jgi:UDP-N-acetylmuramate dehydrogenase
MKIQNNIRLKDKNWFQTGGNTKYFCEPTNKNEFAQALVFANKNHLKTFVLGLGANILINDNGFDGLTIRPQLKQISIKNDLVTAEAGVTIQDLINYCLDNNLVGLEEFSHIPGTVGGSVYINIHYIDHLLSDFLVSAQIINKETTEIKIVDKSWFNFGYDKSTLQKKEYYLIDATFKLKKTGNIETAYAKGRRDEIIRHRQKRYPNTNTCGSFFRNFHVNEIDYKINDKKMIFTAYYLDKIGIKGELRIGNAIVSTQHANMFITLPNATSNDVINLAKKIQQLTFDKFGVIPQPECQLIGFNKNPLQIK